VRVTLPLPPNVRLIDPVTNLVSAETEVDVWRAVPSVFNVKLTGGNDGGTVGPRPPNNTGGYQLDARVADLQEQARGAFVNHAQVALQPTAGLLDDITAFQNVLYSSPRVRAVADALRNGAPLPDADPPLSELAAQGKVVFKRSCATCHGGAGMSTPQPPTIRFSDIGTQCPRRVDTVTPARFAFKPCPERLGRNARTYEIVLADGSVVRRVSSDPGRLLLTGFASTSPANDDWNKLDPPGLHGISRTAPYFHNNSVESLAGVVAHYREFFKRVLALNPPGAALPPILTTDGINVDRPFRPDEEATLLAYLKTL
jgi:cytochrome c peroxidase